MNNYTTFNKLILFTASEYLNSAIKDSLTSDPLHIRIVSGINGFRTFGRFSAEESKQLQEIGTHEYMNKLKKIDVSFVVYALELLRLWVTEVPKEHRKNIYLGVGNKKLLKGKSVFVVDMLKLKQRDEEKYKETREIIDVSTLTAKQFFFYMFEQLKDNK